MFSPNNGNNISVSNSLPFSILENISYLSWWNSRILEGPLSKTRGFGFHRGCNERATMSACSVLGYLVHICANTHTHFSGWNMLYIFTVLFISLVKNLAKIIHSTNQTILQYIGMKMDRIQTYINDITFVFIFVFGFGFEYG